MAKLELEIIPKGLTEFTEKLQGHVNKVVSKMPGLGGTATKTASGGDAGIKILSSLTKMIGVLAVATFFLKAIQNAVGPLLDLVAIMVALFVLPFASILFTYLVPALQLLIRWIYGILGAGPSDKRGKANEAAPGAEGGLNAVANATGNILEFVSQLADTVFPGIHDAFVEGTNIIGSTFETIKIDLNNVALGVSKVASFLKGGFNKLLKFDFVGAITLFGRALGELPKLLFNLISAFILSFGIMLGPIGIILTQNLLKVLTGVFEFLSGVGESAWILFLDFFTGLIEFLTPILDTIKAKAKEIWGGLTTTFQGIVDTIVGTINNLRDGLTGVMQKIVDTISGVVSWISEKINSLTGGAGGLLGGLAGSALKFLTGGDFILTPDGRMIETDPADFLVATKTPGAIGGAGGKTINLTLNINNPQMRDTNDARKLATEIFKILEYELKRGGNYNAVAP